MKELEIQTRYPMELNGKQRLSSLLSAWGMVSKDIQNYRLIPPRKVNVDNVRVGENLSELVSVDWLPFTVRGCVPPLHLNVRVCPTGRIADHAAP